MSQFKTVLQSATVQSTQPLAHAQACKCENNLNIGIFFDGTDNNQNVQEGPVHTNVVRLWQAYKRRPEDGFFRYYVSGVGTPFTEIGKTEAEAFGGPAGAGGEARILYGLLETINSVHTFLNRRARFNLPALAVLCSSARVPDANQDPANRQYRLTAEQKILDDLGLERGLVANARERHEFLSKVRNELSQQVTARATRPQIGAIYIDVFGFSRGAAQARVFVNWLHEHLLIGGNLFGVPSYVRMLGLFDTVASVGLTNAIGNTGHNGWAQAKDLLIHPEVKNCLHYVALQEFRTNFPADSVAIAEGTILPEHCHEHHCPGAHSDVGGGYAAGEQGKGFYLVAIDPRYPPPQGGVKAIKDEGLKLSILPLNEMYEAAVKTCTTHQDMPWIALRSEDGVAAKLPHRFGLERLDAVRKAVDDYFRNSGVSTTPVPNTNVALREHGLRYLAWRYQVTNNKRFDDLQSAQWCSSTDPDPSGHDNYRAGEAIFRKQIMLLGDPPSPRGRDWMGDREAYQGFNPNARDIFAQMKRTGSSRGLEQFFDAWVHDSYAGFIGKFHKGVPTWASITADMAHIVAEGQRYVRWRQLYAGSEVGLNAQSDSDDGRELA